MTFPRRLGTVCCLLFAVGCGSSTTSWVEQARTGDTSERLHAIHELRDRVNEKETVVPVLMEALKDDNNYVRRDAAKALESFGPAAQAAVPSLVARLRDKEPSVRRAAAKALKKIDPGAAARAGIR